MATINQLVRKPRQRKVEKSNVPALQGCPLEAETLARLDSCDMDHATWVRFPRFVGDDGAPSAVARRSRSERRSTARGAVRSGGSPRRRAPLELSR